MSLNEAKLFIALILQDLGKQCDLVIIPEIHLDRVNNCGGPFDYECFKPILLIEVRVHELLHRFDWQPGLSALRIVLDLLLLHITYDILQLLQGQNFWLRRWRPWQSRCVDRGLLRVDWRCEKEVSLASMQITSWIDEGCLRLLRAVLVVDCV